MMLFSDKISLFLIWPETLKAHMVIGVGYREYSTFETYAKIIDGWNEEPRYYIFNHNSKLSSVDGIYITPVTP